MIRRCSRTEPMFPFPLRKRRKRKILPGFDECGSDTSEAKRLNIFKLSLPAFRCLLY